MNGAIVLRFGSVSLRARMALERAGGIVTVDKRRACLVQMPLTADWRPGVVELVHGRLVIADALPDSKAPTVYRWRCARGLCVLWHDVVAGRLLHWRDRLPASR